MSRLKLICVILVTAAITAALTSAFWLIAFNRGQLSSGAQPAPTPSQARSTSLIVGPSGLAIPVDRVRADQLVDTFSAARANGRIHDATDIMAPRGTLVVAAAPGTVERLFFSRGGGGITAYVRSPDGQWQYYYAHLDSYAPGLHEGQAVKRGDPIGRVGSTGDASPQAPHLHFAINRMAAGQSWWQGSPINPYPLLAGKR
jgi:murein DD-endopeptidase MepM/ murein hydrolase activator NlpD